MTPSVARIDTFSQDAPYSLATPSARSLSVHLRVLGETKYASTVNAHAGSRRAADKQIAILFASGGILVWTPAGPRWFPAAIFFAPANVSAFLALSRSERE